MQSIKARIGLLCLSVCGALGLLVWVASHSIIAVQAQAPNAVQQSPSLGTINFSCLGSSISSLGPVSGTESDTAELNAIHAAMTQAWRGVQPASIAPNQQEATQALLREEANALYDFTRKYPSSYWTPTIQLRLGIYYRQHGGYSRALELFELAWESTKSFDVIEVKQVADHSLVQYLGLLTRLGRFERLTALFEEVGTRQLPFETDASMYLTAQEAYNHMFYFPGTSYLCGTYALGHAAKVEGLNGDGLRAISAFKSPAEGFSMEALEEISGQVQSPFVSVFWNESPQIVVPSVVHWKANHYAAITAQHGNWYTVVDPTFGGGPALLRGEDIIAEASGFFLVPQNRIPNDWRRLAPEEKASVLGRGYATMLTDTYDEPGCPKGQGDAGGPGGGSPSIGVGPGSGDGPVAQSSSGCTSCGMPTWSISEPYASLWLSDTPLGYQPSVGPEMAVRLMYRPRGNVFFTAFPSAAFSLIGNGWVFPWRSAVWYGSRAPNGAQNFTLYTAAGSSFTYEFTDASTVADPNYFTHSSLERVIDPVSSNLTSIKIHFPDGSYDVYGLSATNSSGVGSRFALTAKVDSFGHQTQIEYFTYNPNNQYTVIKRVIDPDSNAITFTYDTTAGRTNYVTQVSDYASRTAKLNIDATFNTLVEITDAADITNKVTYGVSGLPDSIVTPYGTTSFDYIAVRAFYAEGRIVTVTEPSGGKQRYAYWSSDSTIPDVLDPNSDGTTTPSSTPIGTLGTWFQDVNTYYWDAANFENLSTNFKTDPENYAATSADLLIAKGRHWLGTLTYGHDNNTGTAAGQTLSAERGPSPDGVTEGQITWYDYAGKWDVNFAGTQIKPGVVARLRPDGTTWYKYTTYTDEGKPLEEIEKWVENGSATYRTNSYTYAGNGIDLVEHRFKATGVDRLVAGYGYNANHQLTSLTNALGEVASWTYNGSGQVVTHQAVSGMVSSNSYGGDGYLAKTVIYEAGIGPVSTNQYTWLNGNLRTHLDPRGLAITNTWDGLARLTKVEYPDGSYIQHAYTNAVGSNLIHRTYTRDRMGNETRVTYNSMQQVASVIDPRGITNLFTYCNCGALETFTKGYSTPLAEVTEYFYDGQGRLIHTDFPDGTYRTNTYDALGRITIVTDALGSVTNTYDNLGRRTRSSNYFGQIFALTYNSEDEITSRTDANGVTVTTTYDDLHRVRTRTFPDGGVEAFGYTANVRGPTSHTNQLSKVTTYAYDKLGRKTTEVVVGLATNTFTFSPASELLTLTDGKSQTTTWAYDIYGRVATKKYADGNTNLIYSYDANSRLTNRWSAAKGNTAYTYDAGGNLTLINYPTSADVSFAYDALNRPTNEVVTSTFTNNFTYIAGGKLATEDGPLPNDTLTYGYNAGGLRSSLAIQQPTGSYTNGYIYDAVGRLTNLTSHAGSFSYSYFATNGGYTSSTRLIRQLTLPPGSYITNSFDNNARRTRTRLLTSGNSELNDHEYLYNLGNQRTQQTFTDDAYVTYTYDDASQLRTAYTTNSGGTEITAQRYMFGYDAAWNMIKRTNNATVTSYTVDSLNQNTTSYSFDSNGNPSSDSSWTYTFDDENRLVAMEIPSGSGTSKIEFFYDARSRLRKKVDYTKVNSVWTVNSTVFYIYDGMMVVQERSAASTPSVTYTRGIDLSGRINGAGGIGGLLARATGYSSGTGAWSTHQYYHADGNGNVTYLMASGETLAASYRYDPFGRTITSSGGSASANTYRFSSKMIVNGPSGGPGFYYYGYRFYDPVTQRWLNRDPILELGGRNIYRMVGNNTIGSVDYLGLSGEIAIPEAPTLPKPTPSSCPKPFVPPPLTPVQQCILVGALCFGLGIEIGNGPVGDIIADLIVPDPDEAPLPLPCPAKHDCELPTKEDCDQQWEDAYELCEKELAMPNPDKDVTGGHGNVRDCAKGHVDEACGGNKSDHGKSPRPKR